MTDDVVVNKIVTDLVAQDKPFTAYNIFQECQKQGVKTPYGDLKKIIRDATSNYTKTNVYKVSKVKTPTGEALLYHPPAYDPELYFAVPKPPDPDGNIDI